MADGREPTAEPLVPKSSPTIPASTRVALGARYGLTKLVVSDRAAIQTPRSTKDTGDHSLIGWVTSYQT